MSHDEPPKEKDLGRPPGDRNILPGDIVVTPVARHYSLGRVGADGKTQVFLESHVHRADALKRACALAGPDHRVFQSRTGGSKAYFPFRCS
jgi:hypothetical protein